VREQGYEALGQYAEDPAVTSIPIGEGTTPHSLLLSETDLCGVSLASSPSLSFKAELIDYKNTPSYDDDGSYSNEMSVTDPYDDQHPDTYPGGVFQ